MTTPTRERLGFGVLHQALLVQMRHVVGISLVFLVAQLPLVIVFATDPTRPPGLGYEERWLEMIVDLLISTSPNAMAVLASTALEALGAAVVLLMVFQQLEGQPASLATSARRGLARVGPVLVTAIFVAAFVIFGFVGYVVPGIFALGYFWMAVPACVVERVGPFRAIGRSGELSSGSVLTIIVLALVTFIAMTLRHEAALAFGLILATRVVFGGLAAVTIAVAYRELRRIKDEANGLALIRAFE